MKGLLICTGKRAEKHPLYIYETRTNIYSVEELCYYIYNNIETLDEKIFNLHMAEFFCRCDRADLAEYLKKVLSSEVPISVEEVVRNIFLEVNYYDRAEVEELCFKIRKLAGQPVEKRFKAMGDALLNAGKYALAEKKYRRLLDMGVNEQQIPASFYGMLWHNLGVVYARMMYFELAAECFNTAYSIYPEGKIKKALFMALTFLGDKEKLNDFSKNEADTDSWKEELKLKEEETDRYLAESGEVNSCIELYNAGEVLKYRERVNQLIDKWKNEYREQTK